MAKKRMRHILKRYSVELDLSEEEYDNFEDANVNIPLTKAPALGKGQKAHMPVEGTSKLIPAFYFNKSGKHYYLPEPHLVLIHVDRAYHLIKNLEESQLKLLDSIKSGVISEGIGGNLYAYFGTCMSCITSLFTAIEAHINMLIPVDYEYTVTESKRTLKYTKDQIQRHISLDEKIKIILKEVTGKSYEKTHQKLWSSIFRLKDIRDEIIHPKTSDQSSTPHETLFQSLIKHNYQASYYAVCHFINFHDANPNLITACPCGKDF